MDFDNSSPEEIIHLAEEGDFEAQYNLGLMYEMGMGVKQDFDSAYKWYLKSAKQSHPKSQYNVGVFLAIGKGVEKNVMLAKEWIKKANKNGYSGGIF
ncbi:MAG: tetratricopeptide repeat protein [Gammaproteobacteria bacterium]|nr:tetratricopeptide repeat protein [Gammaproteobacteria bacterium]